LAGNPRRVIDKEAPEAWSLAEAMGDKKRALRICMSVFWALVMYGQGPALATPEAVTWAERADPLAEPETKERALVDMFLGHVNISRSNPEEGFVQLSRALELARKLGDNNTFWITAGFWIYLVQAPHHAQERLNLAEELLKQSREGIDWATLQIGIGISADALLAMGQRGRIEEILREVRELAERTRQANLQLSIMACDTLLAYMDGSLEEAMTTIGHLFALGHELDLAEYATVWVYIVGTRPLLYLGKLQNIFKMGLSNIRQDATETWHNATGVFYSAHLGRGAEVSEGLNEMVRTRSQMDLREDENRAFSDTLLLEAAILVGHREAADFLLRRFAGSPVRTTGIFWSTIIARHLGAAAAMLGRMDEAQAHYLDAIQVATDMRFRPELALTRFQLAELLLDHYPQERDQAQEHLDFAIKEFEAMKMQPSLERAQALKERF
jgi:tetratricopeptide (TPR) repeat protein